MRFFCLLTVLVAYVLAGKGKDKEDWAYNKAFVEKTIEYQSGDANKTVLEGFLVRPKTIPRNKKYPAVIVFHAFTGRTEFDDDKARDLAKLGYIAFAADTYGKGVGSDDVNTNFATMGVMLGERTGALRTRILAAWNYVNSLSYVDKNRIGSIGFCYGGLCSLDLARFDVGLKAAVGFHATLTNYPSPLNATKTRTSIQCHHGDQDPHSSNQSAADFLNEMRARNGDWQFNRYAHALHAFTMPAVDNMGIPGAAFDPIASNRSFDAMEAFLAEKLLK